MTNDSTGADAAKAVGAKGPEELRRQIEETRSQLGDTVEELAAKADVKARARARAADLKDKAGAMTVQVKSTAALAGHTVQDKASQAGHAVQDTVPGPVRTAATNVVRAGLRHPRPVLIAGAGAVVAAGLLRRRHNGHH
ncbi:DUF3618 domain-containing protein [Streptomyces sp. NPDC058274]|uniref:DUF3618 domain-containing protein n=1 Tax=Streptomyces sp. NPDC058274 TaxID=3346416 RepID=UPI0029CB5BEA|nr:hypothetical protein [Streptomyces sp.]